MASSSSNVYMIRLADASSNPLHPLGAEVRQHICHHLQQAIRDASITSIVLMGSDQHFSAGADLQELTAATKDSADSIFKSSSSSTSLSLLDVIDALDGCPKPIVALIAGSCLGGGLELALACHVRVCLPSAKLGLPEVQVGLIPGAGGTQRLPRLIGLQQALPMILTGKAIDAKHALQLGLVDGIVDNRDLTIHAVADKWAQWAETLPLRRVSQLPCRESLPEAHVMLHMAQLSLPKLGADGMMAALTALRACIQAETFDRGMQVESEHFLKALTSPQGKARRHAFFAVRKAQKLRYPAPIDHPLLQKDVSNVETAVIGAGTMGSGIALVLLRAGYKVVLVDVQETALKRGIQFLHKTIETQQKQGKLKPTVAKDMLQRLRSTMSLNDLSVAQLVVEAAIEKMQIKQSIFKTLKEVAPSALLVTNTSTLDVDAIGSAAGLHFFSPAHVMQLVEIVAGKDTTPETVAVLQLLTKRLGKIGVVVGNCDGFCGNRLLKPYQAETAMLLVEKQDMRPPSIQQVDAALLNFGMALGPFQLSDLAGNDVGFNIRKERGWVRLNQGDPVPRQRPCRYTELPDLMVSELGRNGQKVGKGWYDYDLSVGKGRKGLVSKEMEAFVARFIGSSSLIRGQDEMVEQEIVERVLFPLVNEGFKCLEEGIVREPSDIDVIYLYGYGFPAWRGGPMYWANHDVGLDMLLDKLQKLSCQFPGTDHFMPSELLKSCVRQGMTVEEYCRKVSDGFGHSKL